MEKPAGTDSSEDGSSSCSTRLTRSLTTENGAVDSWLEEDEERATTEPLARPLVDSMEEDEQDSCSASKSNSSSVPLWRVALVLGGQLMIALAIGRFAPKLGRLFADYQCHHNLVDRPAPYSLDESGNLVLFEHLNQPKGPSTVSTQTLKWTSQRFPEALILICSWLLTKTNNKQKNDPLRSPRLFSVCGCSVSLPIRRILETCAAFSGMYASIGVSMFLNRMLKTIGRRRPKFYSLCQFDVDTRQCAGTPRQICSAQFSFPSGHSSLAACSMVFLGCYFCGKLARRTHRWMVCTACGAWAVFVAASRVADRWHHPADAAAGLLLGALAAVAVYRVHYPPPFAPRSAYPRTVLALERRAAAEQCRGGHKGAPGGEGGDEKLGTAIVKSSTVEFL